MLDYKSIIVKRYALNLSGREIAKQIGASKSGVNDFLKMFEECESIGYPLPVGITNYGIAELVYGNPPGNNGRNPSIVYPDYEEVHKQLSGRKNMTLVFLWNRYKKRCEESDTRYYQYRQFCEHYAEWCDENAETLHFNAVIAEKMEVDFAGKTFEITDPLTGEILIVVVFVAILPYSQYIYAEGMLSTKEPEWIEVNNHALDYFGGVPTIVVCDNCKQAVIANEDWIAPELNKDYAEWAEHNQTVILPAKVRKPKYKSSVENAVGILEKGFFHEMEERQYFSLDQFNKDLWTFLDQLNKEPFKKKEHNRYFYWMEEKQELMPLPSVHYEYTERRMAKVSSDFHVRFDNAYYSAPKAYVHKEISIKATATTVRFYTKQGDFLCEWPRAEFKGKWSTNPDHLPANYQGYGQWNAAYFIGKARLTGPSTEAVIQGILKCRKYEVQTYRMCLGVINFGGKYGKPVLEECCRRALEHGKTTYTFIKNTIPAVAEEMGVCVQKGRPAPNEKGGYVMGAGATNIDRLLDKSKKLADSQKGGDQG